MRQAPASPAQEGMWFLHQLAPESPFYNVPLPVPFPSGWDPRRVARALDDLVARHDALRASFRLDGSRPVQVIAPELHLDLAEVDLRDRPRAELQRLAQAEFERPFALEAGPLLRARAVTTGSGSGVLLLTLHHSICDRWSLNLIRRELRALLRGEPLPPATQHSDFARWQEEAMESGALGEQLEWWRRQLAGAPPLLDLPLDRPRPSTASFAGGSVEHELGAGLSARVAALAQESGSTLYMALVAALALLLHRHSGQDDLVLGSWVAGRNRSELESIVGPLANTLPIRVDVAGNPTFTELLARVREAVLGALDHQDVRIETLVRELAPVRTAAHMPLCQVVWTHQNFPEDTVVARHHARAKAAVEVERRSTKYDLVISSTGEGSESGIRLHAEYASDLFEPGSVAAMLERLERVLEQVTEQPATRVAEVDLLAAVERQRLLVDWNQTQAPYPDAPLHHLFSAQAAATPDAPALRHRAHSVTYAELEASSNRVAHRLLELGVKPGDVVGLCAQRSPAMVAGILGALKAGAAYLPLDPAYPLERLSYMLADSRARVLMTTGDPALPAELRLRLDGDLGDNASPLEVAPSEVAYVIYTSGSTGWPKGVMGRHRATVNRLAWMWRAYPFEPGEACCQKTAISFVDSVWEIFGPLLRGVPTVILPDEDVRDPARLVDRLAREGVTRIVLVPSLLRSLLEAEPELGRRLAGLRTWVSSGEALPGELAARFLEAHPDALLLNLYGSSEVAADATFHEVEAARTEEPVPIGRPIANARVFVLDRYRRPAPIGVRGEIFVAGDCLSAGYIHQAALTAERFLELEVAGGALAYRTGDLGRWRRDGVLEYAGRADHQVKIRGFRVEPAEIEAALEEVSDVEAALVVPRPLAGDLQLVAYVATGAGAGIVDRLRAAAARRLPAHMQPAAYVALEAFPLTPNGKVDRLALPAPAEHDPLSGGYVAPRGELEEAVAAVFAEVLRLESVGAHDDFFRLGGHSLTATQVASRLRVRLGREVPLAAIFDASTPARLAAWLASAPETPAVSAVRPRGDDAQLAPASYGQQRLWFLDRLAHGSPAYHIPQTFRFGGELDPVALEAAVNAIVARHAVLRTSFTAEGGELRQRVASELRLRLRRHDLRRLTAAEREAETRRLARDNFRAPFDLARGPLLRAVLVRLADADWVLFTCFHHIVSDGWSMEIFDRELRLYYESLRSGPAPALPPLPVQYADFAAWQREHGVEPGLLSHWVERLRGAPPLDLPTDRARPPVQTLRGQRLVSTLPPALWERVVEFSRERGVTPFMTLLTAFYAVLHRLSGQEDLVVGTPVAGRERIETESLIGFFVNTLALRADLSGDPSFAALLDRVRDVAIDGFAHQQLPFERLVEELALDRDLSRTPVFQVMFVFQNQRQAAIEGLGASESAGDLRRVHWALDRYASKFDLTLTASELGRGLRLQLEYALDLFRAPSMRRFLERYKVLLAAAVEAPGTAVGRLPVLAPGEDELLERFSGLGAGDLDAEDCLHTVFARQVAERPEAVAVVCEGRELTYAELDREANRLARHLAATRGVGRGDRVGVCLERTPELVISLLAILKLGAAYVPLDPGYPPARLALILGDAGVLACVASGDTAAGLRKAPCSVVRLDREAIGIGERRGDAPPRQVAPEDVAYILYTSGSTGRPKGVLVEHRQVLAYARAVARRTRAQAPGIRYAMLQPLTVDSSVTPLWGSLLSGGELHLLDRDLAVDAQRLAAYFHSRRIDHLKIAPSHLRALHAAGDPEALMPRRWLVIGGEGSHWDWVRELPRLRPGCRVFNHYGPTETTVGVTMFSVNSNRARRYDITPIGTPLAHARAYVLDRRGQRVPLGVRGELHFGGPCVARGYLNRGDLDRERFLSDPFAGGRMYRTGDTGRFVGRGVLEFLGRADQQVKIRGFRIELGEIEAVLARNPDVAAAVVQARGRDGDRRVVAYVVGRSGPVAADRLRAFARRELPEHMVPAAVVSLDRLPLTPHGKVDLQALPEPEAPAPSRLVPPATATEKALAEIWQEVLELPEVGATDRFFELGGHSLLATQVLSRVRDRFRVELPLRAIFEQPALGGLAAVVDELSRAR